MDSSAIRAGRAFVEIGADDLNFKKALDRTARQFQAWGAALTGMGARLFAGGAAILGPLLAATQAFASMGAEMAHASARTGIAVEELSRLKYAAEQSGTSFEALVAAITRMNKGLYEAEDAGGKAGSGAAKSAGKAGKAGGKSMGFATQNMSGTMSGGNGGAEKTGKVAKSLQELGITMEQFQSMSVKDKFEAIAAGMQGVGDQGQKTSILANIFGKSLGPQLLPMLEQGKAGIDALMAKADALGLTMSTADSQAALEFSQRLSDLWASVKMGAFVIGGALAPVVRAITIGITQASKAVRDFIAEHKRLVTVAATVGVGLVAAGVAAMALGTAVSIVGTVLAGVSATFAAIGTVVGAILSPIGLLVAGIAAGTYALLRFTNVGQAAGKYLSEVFSALKTDVVGAFKGIEDALAAGNWKLAAEILWTSLKLVFQQGVNTLKTWWIELKTAVMDTWADLWAGAQTVFADFVAGMRTGWAAIVLMATQAAAAVKSIWDNAINAVANAAADVEIVQQAQAAIDAKYRTGYRNKQTRVLGDADAAELAQPTIEAKRKRLMAAGAAADDPRIAEMVKQVEAEFKAKFSGRKLTGAELADLEKAEIQRRREYLEQERSRQSTADSRAFGDKQAAALAEYQAAVKNAADDSQLSKNRIDAERQRQRAADELALKQQIGTATDPKQLEALKKQLAEMEAQAAKDRAAATPAFKPQKEFDPDAAADGLGDMARRATAGTFSSAALYGLGGATIIDKVAANTKATVELLKRIDEALRSAGAPGLPAYQ